MPQRRRPAAGRRPDPCRARWRHSSPRPPPAQRPKVSVLASSSSTCMVNSRSASWRYPVPPAPDRPRCLSEASIPPIAFSRHCRSSRKISTPNWRDSPVAPARHAKAAERPHACAPPSIAGQERACRQSLAWGKRGHQARPHLRFRPINSNFLLKIIAPLSSGQQWTFRLSHFLGPMKSGRTLA